MSRNTSWQTLALEAAAAAAAAAAIGIAEWAIKKGVTGSLRAIAVPRKKRPETGRS